MEILTFGMGGRQIECKRMLAEGLSGVDGRLILLPIPTTRDNKYISGTNTSLVDIACMLRRGDAVAGYSIPYELCLAAGGKGCHVYDGATDEDFLTANASLTAVGALGYILMNSKKGLSDMHVGVVGYGRIGMRLVRLLLQFGCRITVYTNRPDVVMELCENGISAEIVGEISDLSCLDLLVNTAPARQIDEADIPAGLRIIDLASGSIFTPSDRVIKLSSIPEAFYPITAGRLYAEAIMRNIREGKL